MNSDLLAQRGSKTGWLHKKKKGLLGGTSWKRGYWILNGQLQTLREYSNQVESQTVASDRGMVSSYNARLIASVVKEGTDLIAITFSDSSTKLILKCAAADGGNNQDEDDIRDDWIDAFAELQSDLSSNKVTVVSSPTLTSETITSSPLRGGSLLDVLDREASSAHSTGKQEGSSMSPLSLKHTSLLKVASSSSLLKMVPGSPGGSHKSVRGLDSPSIGSSSPLSSQRSVRTSDTGTGSGVLSPTGSVKKSFFDKDMIDTQLFMNKARSLANSINRDTADSIRLKTGVVSSLQSQAAQQSNHHRGVILPHMVAETAVDPARYKKTSEQHAILLSTIRRDVSHFGNTVLVESPESLVDVMFSLQVPRSQKLIIQGETVDRMFVLEQGKVGVYSQDFATRPMELEGMKDQSGEAFGVLSILYNQPGLFTVQTEAESKLWVLSRQRFDEVVTREAKRKVAKKVHMLERIPLIAENLDKVMISQLADSMDFEEYKHGAVIVKRGDVLRRVIIVVEGSCDVVLDKGKGDVAPLKRHDFFGEWVLLEGTYERTKAGSAKSEADLIARTPTVTILNLFVDEVEDLIGPLRAFILKRFRESTIGNSNNSIKSSLEPSTALPSPSPALSSSSPATLAPISQTDESVFVTINPILSAAGQMDNDEEVIRQMTIALKKRETHVLQKNRSGRKNHLGSRETSLRDLEEKKNSSRGLDQVTEDEEQEEDQEASPEAKVVEMQNELEADDDDNDEDIEEKEDGDENLDKEFDKVAPLRPELGLSSLEICGRLGQGSFGTVHLARSKQDPKESFALKVIKGEFIVSNGWEYAVEKERDAMLEIATNLNSPFLLKLFNVVSDSRNVYFVTEVCDGGSLSDLVQATTTSKRIAEDVATFYLGCIVLALDLLHQRDICYRDLKPENVMIDSKGYCKLIDFGLAKKTLRTFTVCGTPDYTAPEVLNRVGHGTAVDWWALGVLCYELLCGTTPFCGFETMDVYENILAHERPDDIVFPNDAVVSSPAKDLISKLLEPKKNKRLGVKFPGVEGLKKHPFFSSGSAALNWELLQSRELAPAIKLQSRAVASEEPGYDAKLEEGAVDKTGWTAKFGNVST